MNVIVFGASGKTGELVVEKALAAGHNVSAFVHAASTFPAGVRVIIDDAQDDVAVRAAIRGQDAVIDTIGGKTPYKSSDLETNAVRNIIDGMTAEGARRLIVVSMMGIGESAEHAPLWYEYLLMPTFLHGATKDKAAMEGVVKASDLDFVIVRPPLLTDDPATGSVHIVGGEHKGHKITRGDLAQFLVDQLTSDENLNQAVVVANS
jgi:putative NADH-flavin reductase